MIELKYGQTVTFTAHSGSVGEAEPQIGVIVDVFSDEFAAEVYLGALADYEAKIEAGNYDEAHEPTWLAYPEELGYKAEELGRDPHIAYTPGLRYAE